MKNVNSSTMKLFNINAVINAVREHGELSRSELAQQIGLTPATITNIVKELLREGIFVEGFKMESRGGRKPTALTLNANTFYILGIELLATDIVMTVTNAIEEVVDSQIIAIDLNLGRDYVIDQIVDEADAFLNRLEIGKTKVKGIGFVTAGPSDLSEGVMINPPNFPGWENTPIRDILSRRIGLPVFFEKESNAAALGEYFFGLAKKSEVLFFCNVFEIGIGGGLIVSGEIFHGAFSNASNIGHTKIESSTNPCTCGDIGCLEAIADGQSTIRLIKASLSGELGQLADPDFDYSQLTFETLIERTNAGDLLCQYAVKHSASMVAYSLANVIKLMSPDTVVIGGDFPDQCPYFFEVCQREIQRIQPESFADIRFYASKLGIRAGTLGAIALVFSQLHRNKSI